MRTMECDQEDNSGAVTLAVDDDSRSAVNSIILDYYKKLGRKRDLEQYFSLSTAQSDIRDPNGIFWRRMKTQNDSSDSGGQRSDSPQELCRISIRCSAPDPLSSQDENIKTKSESASPPIITEEASLETTRHTDDESGKSDDNHSQKSLDVLLDTSTNKPLSPSSSITCQRKLEWDSLADVGYSYESDRKTSASSLSTLERLALQQQYSNNDTKQDGNIGPPTAHSTPLDENDIKSKGKKALVKKTTKIYKKDVDYVEVNVPQSSEINSSQAINVNLTKHISFNVEKDGGVTVAHMKRDVSVSPEKVSVGTDITPHVRMDKEIQTSLTKPKQSDNSSEMPKTIQMPIQRIPVLISLNTLKKRNKRKKLRVNKRKIKNKKKANADKENMPLQEKSCEQLSEAESFEYMPGHIYNQNQMIVNQPEPINIEGNKSSLESSGALTTDSSKGSKHSFTQDLEKSIDLLKAALRKRYDDSDIKTKLVREVCQRLLNSKYRDDESTTDFLSGLSFGSKKLGLGNGSHTTTSTSDANNSIDKPKLSRPNKSILRVDKFNANAIASTSQSAPNLPTATNSEKLVTSNLIKHLNTSNTESDSSSKGKTSSDGAFVRTSSEEFYQKYLEALKREEAYKRHLKDKQMFLKQKLVSSENAFKVPAIVDTKVNNKLKDMIKDLTRNYDDGSGDASKLDGGSNSNIDFERYSAARNQRSHSVFTLSSGNSDCPNKKLNLKKRLQNNLRDLSKPGPSKDGRHFCCCPQYSTDNKLRVTDSSVQVNIKYDEDLFNEKKTVQTDIISKDSVRGDRDSPMNVASVVADNVTGDIKYVCLCNEKPLSLQEVPENFLIYKCSRLTDQIVQAADTPRTTNAVSVQCAVDCSSHKSKVDTEQIHDINRTSKSSQTNLVLNMLRRRSSDKSMTSSSTVTKNNFCTCSQRDLKNNPSDPQNHNQNIFLTEATRCVQTEISIIPRISDPCLSDINIINDVDCAVLISEQHRKTLKPTDNVVYEYQAQSDFDVDAHSGSGKTFATSEDKEKEINYCGLPFIKHSADTNIPLDIFKANDNDSNQAMNMQHIESIADNFTIPIQGTNMTLMVSIGSKESKPIEIEKKNDELVAQAIVKDDPHCIENATSVVDERSKSVQYEKMVSTADADYNCDNINVGQEREQVNTCETPEITKFNTYPKTVEVNAKKPFLRTNTDTDNFDNFFSIQTDRIDQRDTEAQQNFRYPHTQIAKEHTTKVDQKSCRCLDKMTKCMGKCEHIGSSNQSIDQCIQVARDYKKDIGTQRDSPKEKSQTSRAMSSDIESKAMQLSKCQGTCDEQKSCKMDCLCQTYNKKSKAITDISKKLLPSSEIIDKIDSTSSPNLQNAVQIYDCLEETDNVTSDRQNKSQRSTSDSEKHMEFVTSADPILSMIQDITKRYSKKDVEKNKRKKCFKEIMTVLNYLLDTDECTELQSDDQAKASCTSTAADSYSGCNIKKKPETVSGTCLTKKFVDKGIQFSIKKSKSKLRNTESSDLPISTDLPATSSDSATCKVLNKIKKECERYQKRCKCSHGGKRCEVSSSTSVTCEQCRRVHQCPCRGHKCKGHKSKLTTEKMQKQSVAYNLIIQTSESMISEETCDKYRRPLKNIIVKVPSKCKRVDNITFKEMPAKIERDMPKTCSPRRNSKMRSKSLPNDSEISSTEELIKKVQACTVREYLEKNRPDFVEKSSQRQNCLKFISESRNEELCSSPHYKMIVVQTPNCMERFKSMCNGGFPLSCNPCINPYLQTVQNEVTRVVAPKIISEKEMKKHSEKIYKTLPEVVQKKEDVKKENIKKTNLLMANIFKKNLQKKTLRGAVNLSNYSTVIKI